MPTAPLLKIQENTCAYKGYTQLISNSSTCATQLAQLNLRNSTHTQLNLHNSHSSAHTHTTHITQLNLHNSTYTTQLTQLNTHTQLNLHNSHNSTHPHTHTLSSFHITQLAQLNLHNSLNSTKCSMKCGTRQVHWTKSELVSVKNHTK